MSLSTVAVVAFVLACLVVIQRRLHTLPRALLAVVRKERAEDASKLLDAMKEAVAARSAQAVIAIQTYHEQMAQSFRAQVAEAETRARVAERRALDTATALEAATTLVRELRATLDVSATLVRHLFHASAAAPPASSAAPAAPTALPELDDTERQTTEMPALTTGVSSRPQPDPEAAPASGRKPRAVASSGLDEGGDFDDEDEQTRVADRGGVLAALRKARRSPTLLPPAPEPGASPLPRSPGQNDSAC
jgi:hypothetical protein